MGDGYNLIVAKIWKMVFLQKLTQGGNVLTISNNGKICNYTDFVSLEYHPLPQQYTVVVILETLFH